ncbi:hypothetical protein H9P43_000926 [Blastocladiella emersonii ATCC 22665]|nr:hypothetical protein H9P43_000926 [Blastocladiella emersonii ATCC 22665]
MAEDALTGGPFSGVAGVAGLDNIDFGHYTSAQLLALADELEKKNEYLRLENQLFESFYQRSNSGTTSSTAGKYGAAGGGAGDDELAGAAPPGTAARALDAGAPAVGLALDGAAGGAPGAPVLPAAVTVPAPALVRAPAKKKKGDKVKQAADVIILLTAEQKSEIATRELEELRDELERRRAEWSRAVDNLRAEMEEIEIGLAEIKKALYEFRRDIVAGALNERTGKVMAEKVVRYFEDKMRARDTTLEKIRLKNATLKTHKNKLMLQLRQKEEMGEVLHAIDFDQLKIENHQYLAKIEERNAELLKLKMVAGNIVQVMNVFKRRLGGLEEESAKLRAELGLRRELLERLRVESEAVRKETNKALKVCKTLVTTGREFSVPSVMEYVMLKAEQQEVLTKVRSWRRKVEIAQMSLQRSQRPSQDPPRGDSPKLKRGSIAATRPHNITYRTFATLGIALATRSPVALPTLATMSLNTSGTPAAGGDAGGFLLEQPNASARVTGVHESLLQECERDIIWYRDYFFGKAHINFVAKASARGPLAVSLVLDGDNYKGLVRTTEGSERLTVPRDSVVTAWWRKLFGMPPTPTSIMRALSPQIPIQSLKLCKDVGLPNELLAMEERQVIRSYKFGLGYLRAGQNSEEHLFSNTEEDMSVEFKEFLNFIGETIELKGWRGYRAGLDVSNEQTGKHSVYTKWQGYEIMFHVSTYLPHTTHDKQQLEKKRHIGNDIVVLIFQDSDTAFELPTLTSKQNHVVIAVRPDGDKYVIAASYKNGVPHFNPEIPDPPQFNRDAVGRDFLLHKLVNAERASYKSPSFAPKISRTRNVLLLDVAERFEGS